MKTKHFAILLVIVAAVSSAVTKYYFPRIETKTVEITKESTKNDIKVIKREFVKPDGSKVILTRTSDKSTKEESSSKESIITSKPNWFIGLSAKSNLKDSELGYELTVARRQFGPFYLMGQVGVKKSETTFGVGIAVEY